MYLCTILDEDKKEHKCVRCIYSKKSNNLNLDKLTKKY